MAIIDFHAHYFSRVFFETLAQQSPLPGSVAEKLETVRQRTGIELPAADEQAHQARWIAELDRNGVEHLCAFASVPEEMALVAQAARSSAGRLSAFTLIHPRSEGILEKLPQILGTHGHKGVLLFPALHGYRIDAPQLRPVFEILEAHQAIVYAHCGLFSVKLRELLGLSRPQDLRDADPLALLPVAMAFPRLRLVIPHFGAGMLRETLLVGAQARNVYTDTSSSHSWLATQCPRPQLSEVFASALASFGPERILFGTDSTTFPTGWQRARYQEQKAALESIGASAAVQERIFANNARELLALS